MSDGRCLPSASSVVAREEWLVGASSSCPKTCVKAMRHLRVYSMSCPSGIHLLFYLWHNSFVPYVPICHASWQILLLIYISCFFLLSASLKADYRCKYSISCRYRQRNYLVIMQSFLHQLFQLAFYVILYPIGYKICVYFKEYTFSGIINNSSPHGIHTISNRFHKPS